VASSLVGKGESGWDKYIVRQRRWHTESLQLVGTRSDNKLYLVAGPAA